MALITAHWQLGVARPDWGQREVLGLKLKLLWLPHLGASWLGLGLTTCSAYEWELELWRELTVLSDFHYV